MRGRRESWPRRCGTTPSSARASIRSSRSSSGAPPSLKIASESVPSGSADCPVTSTSSSRYALSNDPRVRKDVRLIAAPGRELRDDGALVAGLKPVQRVRRDRVLIAGPQHELFAAFDVQVNGAATAPERLLLARRAADRRVAVLGACLPCKEHELLRAHALRVHVDDELEPDLLETLEHEVGDFDRLTLGRCQHDARLREHRRRALPRLGVGHSETGLPFDADSYSA